MQDLTALEGKTILELREIAKVLGITPSNMKKQELLEKIVSAAGKQAVAHSVAKDGTKWIFNPPGAPHHGGK